MSLQRENYNINSKYNLFFLNIFSFKYLQRNNQNLSAYKTRHEGLKTTFQYIGQYPDTIADIEKLEKFRRQNPEIQSRLNSIHDLPLSQLDDTVLSELKEAERLHTEMVIVRNECITEYEKSVNGVPEETGKILRERFSKNMEEFVDVYYFVFYYCTYSLLMRWNYIFIN